ncbi:Hypothetical protein SMAX5B_019209 [Scophthalmus maximus]|uniref:Uncharacterized protein n=1 Tax=Scophthalmus maximus TaxID=52904 RepID=A0A2U9C6E7_SCOMX|nr:Hypothetical protein SMAX5B_019209 [Scophthalmus maximus]
MDGDVQYGVVVNTLLVLFALQPVIHHDSKLMRIHQADALRMTESSKSVISPIQQHRDARVIKRGHKGRTYNGRKRWQQDGGGSASITCERFSKFSPVRGLLGDEDELSSRFALKNLLIRFRTSLSYCGNGTRKKSSVNSSRHRPPEGSDHFTNAPLSFPPSYPECFAQT